MDKKIFFWNKNFFETHPKALVFLKFIYKILPNILFLCYPVMLVLTLVFSGLTDKWTRLVLVPFFVLLLVSVLRFLINEQRPYERFGEPSAFNKKTVGKSMPSRHTASAFVIAMAFLSVNIPSGIVAMIVALLIMLSRVMAGAHYLRDVLVGALIAVTTGVLMFL